MQEIMVGHDSGNRIAAEAEIHDKALEKLKECIDKTYNVTLLAKLYQNKELQDLVFEKLYEIAFDESGDDEIVLNAKAQALNEIVQITNESKLKSMTSKNKGAFVKSGE